MNYRRQATHFSTENSINKPAVSNGRLLIAAVFHFVHLVEKTQKTSQFNTELCQLQLSKETTWKMLHTVRLPLLNFKNTGWILASKVSLKSKSLQYGAMVTKTQHISYESLETINLSLRSFESGNLSADNFKKIFHLNGWTLEPAVRSGDTGQRMPCFDSCQLITTLMCN